MQSVAFILCGLNVGTKKLQSDFKVSGYIISVWGFPRVKEGVLL